MKNKINRLIMILIIINTVCYGDTQLTRIVNYIISKEGFVAYPQQDCDNVIIGYCINIKYSKKHGYVSGKISKHMAYHILVCRVLDDRKELIKKINNFNDLPEVVIIAVQSAYFNSKSLVGPRLTLFLNNREFYKASRELAWDNSPNYDQPGLVNRRFSEANMIRKYLGLPLLKAPRTVYEFYKRKQYNLPEIN